MRIRVVLALAGLAVGFWSDPAALGATAAIGARIFEPTLSADERDGLYAGWKRAVERSRGWSEE